MNTKSLMACTLSALLVITPVTASAHGHFHGGGLVFGLVAGAAAAVTAVALLPINVVSAVASAPAPSYSSGPAYQSAPSYPQQNYYPPQQAYYTAPAYYPPQPYYYGAPAYYR